MQDRTIFERAGAEKLLGVLKDPASGADGATLQAALVRHLERSLGQSETVVPTGDAMSDRLERFFDNIFVVEPAAAVPYSLEELQQLFKKTVGVIANKHDAADYRKLAKLTDLEKALTEYQKLDTYGRGYIYFNSVGMDEARFAATLDSNQLDSRFY